MSPFAKFAAVLALSLAGTSVQRAVPVPEAGPRPPGLAVPGRLAPRTWNDTDGLPQNTVISLAFDRKGYLWAGTFDGAARFNGSTWKTVNMPNRTLSNDVRTILPAEDGSIWFGTFSGGLHNLAGDRWTSFDMSSSPLPDNQIRGLTETTPGTLWIATLGGVARFDGDRWTVYGVEAGLPSAEVWSIIAPDPVEVPSNLWAATSAGVARFDAGRWLAAGGPAGQATCLLATRTRDGKITIWAGTKNEGLWRFENDTWSRLGQTEGLPSDSINCLFEASPGGTASVLVGTSEGLSRIEAGTAVSHMLEDRDVRSVIQSPAGDGPSTLWLGTTGDGVARIRDNQWTVVDTAAGLKSNKVRCLLETTSERGAPVYWFGTIGGGLARFEDGRLQIFDETSGLPADDVAAFLETGAPGARTQWISVDGAGLVRIRGSSRTLFNRASGFPDERVWSLLETRNGNGSATLWAGTYGGGLARFDGDRLTVHTTKDGLPSDRIWSLLATTDGDGATTLWVGTASGGLARLRGGEWKTYDTRSGLPNNGVWALHETREANGSRALWIGTDGGGVARLDLDANGVEPDTPVWTVFSDATDPALPNNIVYRIEEDASHRLYLCTNRGVARLSRSDSGYSIRTFTTEDGLPGNECMIGASTVDSRGRVWVGTNAGAAVFDPAAEVEDATSKPLYIERAVVTNRAGSLLTGEALSYDENHVSFGYALLSFHRGGDTRYRTELVGLDPAPTDWTPDAKREFPTLPEGSYDFRVWGRDYAGNVSGPVSVSFSVRPAPWRTWWAYLLYAAMALVLGFVAVRWRLRTLEHRNRLLERGIAERTVELADAVEQMKTSQQAAIEAAERAHESEQRAIDANRAKSVFLANISHELRTPLNAILGFPQVMAADRNLPAEHLDTLAIITRSGEHLLGLINDVLSISKIEAGKTSLTEQPFDLRKLLQALEEMIQIRARSKGLQCIFDISPDLPHYVSGDEGKLRQVVLNLLGNAVKFTSEGGVALRATWNDGHVFFEVEDTGHGIADEELGSLFEPFVQTESGRKSTDGTGLGLAISRNFVELMRGSISVRSALGQGTVFSLTIPLSIVEGPEAVPEPRRVERLAPGQPDWRILIADDKIENRLLLAKILKRIGLDIREAANGAEAIEIWRSWRPHLIWMDVRMPVLDGIGATREILRLQAGDTNASPVIIALTASVFERDRAEILAAGCADFVTKPFREAVIFDKMTEHLHMRFVYEEPVDGEPATSKRVVPGSLSAEACAGLSKDLLGELKQSMETGDIERANVAIDRIPESSRQLAAEIRLLVRAYRFDDVQRAVEAALAAK